MSVQQRASLQRAPARSGGILPIGGLLGLLAAVLTLGSLPAVAAQDKPIVTIRPAPPRSAHPAPAASAPRASAPTTPAPQQAAAPQRRSRRQVATAHIRRRTRRHAAEETNVAAAPQPPERHVRTARRSERTRVANRQLEDASKTVTQETPRVAAASRRRTRGRVADNRDTHPTEDAQTSDTTDTPPRRRRHSRRAETAARSDSDSQTDVGSGKGAAGLNTIGFRLIRQHRYAEAEPYLRRAVAKDPNYAYAQYNLGCCLLSQGKASQALGPLQRSAAQQPERWEPQEKIAEAYRRLDDEERAKAASARAKRLRWHRRPGRAFPSSGPNVAQAVPARSAIDSNSWRGSTDPKEQRFLTEWRAMR